jgi:hypothetical protein
MPLPGQDLHGRWLRRQKEFEEDTIRRIEQGTKENDHRSNRWFF